MLSGFELYPRWVPLKRPRDWLSNLSSAQPFPCLAQFPKMAIIICLYFYLVLRLHEADLK